MSVVVLQTSFLGDMVLTTPLLDRLAKDEPDGQVHVVATRENAGLLHNHPAVSSVIVFDKHGGDLGVNGLRRVAARIRATGATRALAAQGSWRTALLARLSGIPEIIGFDTSAARHMYTQQVHYQTHWHHAGRLWSLASPPSDTVPQEPALRPTLYPDSEDSLRVETLLRRHGALGRPLIVLAPASAVEAKRWPRFAELAVLLAAALQEEKQDASLRETKIVVMGSTQDAELAAAIARQVDLSGRPPVIDATGRLGLLASTALLAQARALVSNDSLPIHLASATNTPTVALFGPTVPELGFGPLAEHSIALASTKTGGRQCGAPQAHLKHWQSSDWDSLENLSLPSVLNATLKLARRLPQG